MTIALEIHQLTHHCELIQGGNSASNSVNTLLCKQELARLSNDTGHSLVQVLASHMEQLAIDKFSSDAIICIRKLDINFSILLENLHNQYLTNDISQRLVEALLTEYLEGKQDNIQVFDNEAHYFAQYIASLMNYGDKPRWCFQDVNLHQYLSTQEAVVNCLANKSDLLPAVCTHLKKVGVLGHIAKFIDDAQATWLCERWCYDYVDLSFNERSIENIMTGSGSLIKQKNAYKRSLAKPAAFVDMFLDSLTESLVVVSKQYFSTQLIYFGVLAYPQQILKAIESTQNKNLPLEDWTDVPNFVRPCLIRLCNLAIESPSLRKLIINNLREEQEQAYAKDAHPPMNTNHLKESNLVGFEEEWQLWSEVSEVAGLSLLFPTMVSLGLERYYSLANLCEAMKYILDNQGIDTQQIWLHRLFNENLAIQEDVCKHAKSEHYNGEIPEILLLGLHTSIKQKLRSTKGKERLARLIISQFAARLSGMQMSSQEYLFDQFFHIKGSIQAHGNQVNIMLDTIPLNIVLKMSGLSPWTGQLAWLNKRLHIEVRE